MFWRFVHFIFTGVQRSLTTGVYDIPLRLCAAPTRLPCPSGSGFVRLALVGRQGGPVRFWV